jgi:hypothetical protein
MTGHFSVRVHDLLVSDVVCDEVKASSHSLYSLKLELESVGLSEVEFLNDRCKLKSHLDELSFLWFALTVKVKTVFQDKISFDIKGKDVCLVELKGFVDGYFDSLSSAFDIYYEVRTVLA